MNVAGERGEVNVVAAGDLIVLAREGPLEDIWALVEPGRHLSAVIQDGLV